MEAARKNPDPRDFEVLSIDDLNVDHAYQRDLDQTLAQKIAREFDIAAMDPITVSQRADGTLWIVNGQRRAAAAKIAGEAEILADVHRGLTRETEADRRLKGNTRRTDKSLERFKAQVAAGYPESVAIEKLCASFETRMNRWVDPNNGINAVSTVEAIYRVDGGILLTRTFEIIRDTFDKIGGHTASVSMLKAIAFLLTKHAGEFKRARLIERLGKEGIESIERKARTHKAMVGGSLWANFYRAIIEIYNHQLPEMSRIEPRKGGVASFALTQGQREVRVKIDGGPFTSRE